MNEFLGEVQQFSGEVKQFSGEVKQFSGEVQDISGEVCTSPQNLAMVTKYTKIKSILYVPVAIPIQIILRGVYVFRLLEYDSNL